MSKKDNFFILREFEGKFRNKNSSLFILQYTLIARWVVACRAFASEAIVNEYFNLIPHCIAFGQAAGTAAAQAISSGVDLRKINIKALQASLKKQGVILPV